MNALWFVGGAMLGGGVTLMFMCCFQINRINDYEETIRLLQKNK